MRIDRFIISCLVILASLVSELMIGTADAENSARLVTYQEQGTTTYALSLMADLPAKEVARSAVVVLFDTSASQQGEYRTAALAALDTLLAGLNPSDQVELMGVDLKVNRLTAEFATPGSTELKSAVEKLQQQVPLGSTDLATALTTAVERLKTTSAAQRSIVYIGDGISTANLLDKETLSATVSRLREARASVSSFAVGPKVDSHLLAALANQSGGNITIQISEGDNTRNAQLAGKDLIAAVRGQVLWPEVVNLPPTMGQAYPAVLPPLRSDRDTILVGTTQDVLPAELAIEVAATDGSKSSTYSWTVNPEVSQEDNAFLQEVVEIARADEGLSLPTVGSAGLLEVARLIGAQMDGLTQIAQHAAVSGDRQTALRIAEAVLHNEPGNVQARTVQNFVEGEEVIAPVDGGLILEDAAVEGEIVVSEPIVAGEFVEGDIIVSESEVEGDVILVRPEGEGFSAPVVGEIILGEPEEDLLGSMPGDGEFLDEVEQERRVFAEMLSKETQNTILESRGLMSTDPLVAIQDLKLAQESVQRAVDLSPEKRAELLDKLESAIKEAQHQAFLKDEIDREREEALAAARESKLLNERFEQKIEKEKQLMERFNALVDEQRYLEAKEVAQVVEEIDPNGVTPRVASLWVSFKRHHYLQQVARAARHQAFFDTMYQNEISHIPFPDDPPIIYPDAEEWEALTARRKKFASVDLSARSKAEEQIQSALRETLKAPLQYEDQPLNEVIDTLQEEYDIPIMFDNAALDELAISPDTEVTINLRNISLQSALNHILRQPGLEDLTYTIDDEVLLITTEEKANESLKVKVYPVADLVLQIENLGLTGGLGGASGGGGGLGGGGGGGGLGGGGGGGFGGGGGGGGGGLGGGGGGGLFNVQDEEDTSPKENPAPATRPGSDTDSKSASQSAPTDWSKKLEDQKLGPAQLRKSARDLMRAGKPQEVVSLIEAAIHNGQSQPWMYESLGIAMELSGRPKSDIERAVMSACDFISSAEELLLIAQYMSHIELDARALEIYRQVAKMPGLHPDAFALGLRAAQRMKDNAGIRWATLGVLENSWSQDQQGIYETASRVAQATLEEMKASGDPNYTSYQAAVTAAQSRDVVIQVSWTGDADIDLIVEEPGGTVCSVQQPRTTGGGVCVGDIAAGHTPDKSATFRENYSCSQAFPGTYRARLRKVYGEVVAGKVIVDVYKHFGSDQVVHERQHLPVRDDSDVMVVFELESGRRVDSLKSEQLEVAIKRHEDLSRSVLAQQFGDISDPRIIPSRGGLGADDNLARRLALAGQGGAVGFQPIIQTLPDGVQMVATAVVSADRRYVRVNSSPSFTGIGDVATFSFASQVQNQGGGLGGGGGGGI